MTEDMRRGGGVASTSWMIWMAWGWQRKRWPGLCLSGSQSRTRSAAEAAGWSMIAGICGGLSERASELITRRAIVATRGESSSCRKHPHEKEALALEIHAIKSEMIPSFGSRSDLRSSPLPFDARTSEIEMFTPRRKSRVNQGIHIPSFGPPFPCLVLFSIPIFTFIVAYRSQPTVPDNQ